MVTEDSAIVARLAGRGRDRSSDALPIAAISKVNRVEKLTDCVSVPTDDAIVALV
jgi:hypothetical protein